MEIVAALSGPVIALAGVWLGSWLSFRGQDRARERDDRQRNTAAAQAACGEYLVASRHFDQYIKLASTQILAVSNPAGTHPIPVFDERGESYQHELETASARLLFAAVSSDVVEHAGQLRLALMRMAAARAGQAAGAVPDGPVRSVLAAERAFVESARDFLGFEPLSGIVRTLPPIPSQ